VRNLAAKCRENALKNQQKSLFFTYFCLKIKIPFKNNTFPVVLLFLKGVNHKIKN